MKKYLTFGLIASIIPVMCMAEHPRVTELIRQKQEKMARLEKCTGSTNGLKIAGISTLGLTAVGVAGNIAEAAVINKYDKKISDVDKKIDTTQIEIDQKLKDNIDKKNREDERKRALAEEEERQKAAQDESRRLKNVAAQDIATINSRGGTVGDVAVTRGYQPEQLPANIGNNLRSDFADAMIRFITKCRALIGKDGIKEVSLTTAETEKWKNIPKNNALDENYILPDLTEHIIAKCSVTECEATTHTLQNDACVPNGTTPDNNGDNGTSLKDGDDCKTNGALVAKWSTKYNKCVAKTCDEQNGWELAMKDGDSQGWCRKKKNGGGDGDDQGGGNNDSCTQEQLNLLRALSGNIESGKCVPTKCKGDLELKEDKLFGRKCSCPDGTTPQQNDPTQCATQLPEKCDANTLNSLHATLGTKKQGGCFVQKCINGYHLELNGKKYEVDEYEDVDLNMKCVQDKPRDGDDCTKDAKKLDSNATKGKIKNGECKITECLGDMLPSPDGKKCEKKMPLVVEPLPNDNTYVNIKNPIQPILNTDFRDAPQRASFEQKCKEAGGQYLCLRNAKESKCLLKNANQSICEAMGDAYPVNLKDCRLRQNYPCP